MVGPSAGGAGPAVSIADAEILASVSEPVAAPVMAVPPLPPPAAAAAAPPAAAAAGAVQPAAVRGANIFL